MTAVGITANRTIDDDVHREWIRRRYIDALTDHADVEVVILPTVSGGLGRDVSVLARLDGLVLTGDESNVDPAVLRDCGALSDGVEYVPATRDHYRDRLSGRAIATALALGMPILAICRGLQELNVHFGGTLHGDLESLPGGLRHHEDIGLERDRQYDPVHRLSLTAGATLHGLAGTTEIRVNSLHHQGIDRLGRGLFVEARSDDGLIEAVSVADAAAFQIGVQWHPEWHVATDAFSQSLFSAFGNACRSYRKKSSVIPAGATRLYSTIPR